MTIGSHQSPTAITTTWLTPPEILSDLGEFDLDPCCPESMPWKTAKRNFTKKDNGLIQPWVGRVWLNPPYGREVDEWMKKMAEHNHGIALIFARTETNFWHNYIWHNATAIKFLRGRIHFHLPDGTKANGNAGAPSALVAYGKEDADIVCKSKIDGYNVILDNNKENING